MNYQNIITSPALLEKCHSFDQTRSCWKAASQWITLTTAKKYEFDLYNSKTWKALEKTWDILDKLLKNIRSIHAISAIFYGPRQTVQRDTP